MSRAPRPLRRRTTRLLSLAVAALALPLMAPTCGTSDPGPKAFSKGSLIIPMDACYQNTPTTLTNTTWFTPYSGCPSNGTTTSDHGNVLRAYGLVYQLLRNGITVYWVINPAKNPTGQAPSYLADPGAPDITLSLDGGAPVSKYDWSTGALGGMPPNNSGFTINYHGGPFVVDGSDQAAALAVLQQFKTTFGGIPPSTANGPNVVNVHVANVAFKANVAKTMNGGFLNSGGSVAPPVALLNITGGDNKNSESVLQGYLVDAGLGPADFAGAGGTPTPNGHGKIYDDLYPSDFLPVSCTTTCANGSPCTGGKCAPSLSYFKYAVLWVPHWCGKGSETKTQANGVPWPAGFTYLDVLTTIRGFMDAGGDVMSECAGVGSFEGVGNSTACNGAANTFEPATAGQATKVQTTTGVNVNETSLDTTGATYRGNFASPFLQLGDFPYKPITGAIQQYSPVASYVTRPAGFELLRLISDKTNSAKDYFSVLPAYNGTGTVVYLAGHDFSGGQGATPQIAGSRLVLNTLFNLGSACVSTGAACNTGQLGVCAAGTMQCVQGVPTCVRTTGPSPEVCNGLDDDCNGAVDDGLTQGCYDGPAGTNGVGVCRGGVTSCQQDAQGHYAMTACVGEVTPTPEVCNGLDDDCNGAVDDGLAPQPCYDGPAGTAGVGACRAGTQACVSGSWGACTGEVLPGPEICGSDGTGNGIDENCDGVVDEGCGCLYGTTPPRPCYGGPPGTAGVGSCRAGTQACTSVGLWGTCTGQVLPVTDPSLLCPNPTGAADQDCDGRIDACPVCADGATRPCYPASTPGCVDLGGGAFDCTGTCAPGVETCTGGQWSGACTGAILPGPELCDGKNESCSAAWAGDGADALCRAGTACVNGVCVPSSCGVEAAQCPAGYACDAGTSTCALASCGTAPGSTACPAGQACTVSGSGVGTCSDPCAGPSAPTCGKGAFCSGGLCTGGGCDATGCAAGQICVSGACVDDPCSLAAGGPACPPGTFCRSGDCVQACAFVTCGAGERCGADGFCVADPCTGHVCGPGQVCEASGGTAACVADPCASLSCGARQVCVDGTCVDDLCAQVTCPVGVCLRGQCYSTENPTGAGGGGGGGSTTPPSATGGGGCGCGTGEASPLAAIALLLAWPLARRRRRGGAGGLAALAFAILLLGGSACASKKTAADAGTCTDTLCGAQCSDLRSDPANCGACGAACASGQICVDAVCGPSTAVAPYVTGVSPASAARGGAGPTSIQLTGQRFAPGATVRALGLSSGAIPATVADAGHLTASLDLSAAAPGTIELRVVNPDRVISNGIPFEVTLEAPRVDGISPSTGLTGATTPVAIAVTGAGFLPAPPGGASPASQCLVSGAGFPELGLPTTYVSPTQLSCAFSLASVPPGAYALVVANEGLLRSAPATFTVTAATPALAAISPTSGAAGSTVGLTVTGSGFDARSVVKFDGVALPTTYLAPTQLYASPLDLTGAAAGPHQVVVANAAGTTSPATFTVTPNPPELASISPVSARQGDSVTLVATGDHLDASTRIEVLPPGATTWQALPTTPVSATQLSAPWSLAGQPDGGWLVRLSNALGATGALAFRVSSNVAVLSSLSPSSAQQGTAATLTLGASNLQAGATVHLAASGFARDFVPGTPGASTLTVPLDLAGWTAQSYAVTVVNPGAQPSNGLAFTVTPGQPAIASISPSCVVQSAANTAVPVTITGSNFAGGAAASVVHAASPPLVTDAIVPSTTVDASSITVTLDSTAAVAGTYTITVWNPGATILRSNGVSFTVGASCP